MNIHTYTNMETLATTLSHTIARTLNAAVESRGIAGLLVSGGSSPIGLFGKLSEEDIDWRKVHIGLVDERFVPADHEKSNERLVREHLLVNRAKSATFIGMVYHPQSREENLEAAREHYDIFTKHLDAVVLGMGLDGHTASLFPGDPPSEAALTAECHESLVNTTAPVAPVERISCTLPLLRKSRNLYLLTSGSEKMKVLKEAARLHLPIAAFAGGTGPELAVHHCQN